MCYRVFSKNPRRYFQIASNFFQRKYLTFRGLRRREVRQFSEDLAIKFRPSDLSLVENLDLFIVPPAIFDLVPDQ
jgi:hypothetical protein